MKIPALTAREATQKLKDGALLIAPFDHMYAVIAYAKSEEAMTKMRRIKDRDASKGFTILVDSDARLNRYVKEVPALAWDIIDAAVDPLILVLPNGVNVSPQALANDGSIAIRMVQTPDELQLVQAANGPVACTSLLRHDGSLAKSIDEADSAVLEAVDYLLTLPTQKNPRSLNKTPIVALGMESEVRIIRE